MLFCDLSGPVLANLFSTWFGFLSIWFPCGSQCLLLLFRNVLCYCKMSFVIVVFKNAEIFCPLFYWLLLYEEAQDLSTTSFASSISDDHIKPTSAVREVQFFLASNYLILQPVGFVCSTIRSHSLVHPLTRLKYPRQRLKRTSILNLKIANV